MMDATDYDLFPEARRMLDDLLKSEEVAGLPVVIFVNKIDHYGAVGPEDFLTLMRLDMNRKEDGTAGLETLRRERAIEVVFGSVVLGQSMYAVGLYHVLGGVSSLLCGVMRELRTVLCCANLDRIRYW
jgi:hypothetical protein